MLVQGQVGIIATTSSIAAGGAFSMTWEEIPA